MVAFVYLANVGLLQYCHGAGLATISQGGNAIDHIGFQIQAQQVVGIGATHDETGVFWRFRHIA